MLNSLTTTVIKLVSRWPHLKHYMGESIERYCTGARQEKLGFGARNSSRSGKTGPDNSG
jgi:hypothetical protein